VTTDDGIVSLRVEVPSKHGTQTVEIGTASDPGRADRLDIAITGQGAFRRFRNVLSRWPEEADRWREFSTERERGPRAVAVDSRSSTC
jgi:hypothetical protein